MLRKIIYLTALLTVLVAPVQAAVPVSLPARTVQTRPALVEPAPVEQPGPALIAPTAMVSATTGIEAWDELPPEVQAKVDPRLLAEFKGEVLPAHLSGQAISAPPGVDPQPLEKTRFIVYLKKQADLDRVTARRFTSALAQRQAVTDVLLTTAQTTQGAVKTVLETQRAAGGVAGYFPFYIFNGLAVEGDLATVIELARRADVERITANYALVKLADPAVAAAPESAGGVGGLDPANWNIDLVDADRVWNELGVNGAGAVVADFDTGAQWDHPALKASYRGWNGTTVDHNYNWFEFNASNTAYWDPNGNYGASATTVPYVCDSHGIHTLGTMVGDGGTAATKIGMAPGAKWMAVPGICGTTMPSSTNAADSIGGIRTFQWLMCPTDLTGDLATRDCSKAPDVVNNSWGSSDPADETFRPVIQALRAAGVVPVFASGNPSAGAGSIGSPASVPEAVTVGATDNTDTVASFSGRGPSFYTGVQKPNLTAPGVSVLSSVAGNGYGSYSGTSMAAPHVAGLVALLVSADLKDGQRDLNVDEIQAFLEHTAVDLGPSGPDDDYGYGRIDAYAAVRWVLAAGDLRGQVTDAVSGGPVARATLSGRKGIDTFGAHAAADGAYSVTVPGGAYQVNVAAFGYAPASFKNVAVVTGTASVVNFNLSPLPTASVHGAVLSGTQPVAGARVYAEGRPEEVAIAGTDGAYALTMPVGAYTVTVEAEGYRIVRRLVTVAAGGTAQDINLAPAPTILLVEADAYRGWFYSRPAANFFKWSLDRRNYLYAETAITNPDLMPDLTGYDVVIWVHTLGSPSASWYTTSLLQNYLNGGGRLILSGQDIASADAYAPFFQDYLHAAYMSGYAAGEGSTVAGGGFLEGLNLTIYNAALYGYANTTIGLSPDAVSPRDGSAYPIMMYANGAGAAALAVDPCGANYRAVYFAVGYENLGPRAYAQPEAYADVLERSLQWLMDSKPQRAVNIFLEPIQKVVSAGATATYTLQVRNSGALDDTFNLTLAGNTWPTALYSGGAPVSRTAVLAACALQTVEARVSVPGAAAAGAADSYSVTVTSAAQPAATAQAGARTIAFPDWQAQSDEGSSAGLYWMAGAGDQCSPYAIGGMDNSASARADVQAYDVSANRWVTKAAKPTGVFGVGVGVLNDRFYVPGGYADGWADDWGSTDVLEIYNPAADTWSAGADLPGKRGGSSAAVANGKLYVFGGGPTTMFADIYRAVWEYNPATNAWTVKGDMPYQMVFGGATSLGGKIYVGGDYRGYQYFYEYDPAADTWTQKADLPDGGRKDPILVGAGGKVYLYGGDSGRWGSYYTTAFAYDPTGDTWSQVASNRQYHIAGVGAYASGRLWAYGNSMGRFGTESVTLAASFCNSTKTVQQALVQPGELVTYTLDLHSGPAALANVQVTDPLPAGTTFAGFGPTGLTPAPVYNAAQNRIEWTGALPGNQPPQTLTFGVRLAAEGWRSGQPLTNRAVFAAGAGLAFTRTAVSRVEFFDLAASTKMVDKAQALSGDVLTYTLQLTNESQQAGSFTLADPLPAHTQYVPGSLTADSGQAAFADGWLTWTGELPVGTVYTNTGAAYVWGDSDGNGLMPGVVFAWQDMTGALDTWVSSDNYMFGPFPVGFDFNFYGADYSQFYASPQGWVGFTSPTAYGGGGVDCYSYGSSYAPNNFIGGFAGQRAVYAADGGSITYKLFGVAPNRYLVVQFTNIRYIYSSNADTLDMQIILHEGSNGIQVQYQDLTTSPTPAYLGIESDGPAYAYLPYQDTCPASIHDRLALMFLPPGETYQGLVNQTALTFAVQTSATLPSNTWITNTATFTDSRQVVYQRSAATLLNAIDLRSSTKTVDHATVAYGEDVRYTLTVKNSGVLPATEVTMTDPLPAELTYLGDVTCAAGACGYASGVITWTGTLTPGQSVRVDFGARLTTALAEGTLVTNTAHITGGIGVVTPRAIFRAINSDLTASTKQVTPEIARDGEVVTYTLYVHNAGQAAVSVQLTDTLPAGLHYVPDSLVYGVGVGRVVYEVLTWEGTVPARSRVPVEFQAVVDLSAINDTAITNTAHLTGGDQTLDRQAVLPVIRTPLAGSVKTVMPGQARPGDIVTYTLAISNSSGIDVSTQLTDVLPSGLTYVPGSLVFEVGSGSFANGVVTWTGTVPAAGQVRVQFQAVIDAGVVNDMVITNTAVITLETGEIRRSVSLMVLDGLKKLYLPFIRR